MAYHSPNQRYLYIDPPIQQQALVVGRHTQIKVYLAAPSYLPIKSLSYLVRGRRCGPPFCLSSCRCNQ